jgi:fructosamine-3-kinase
MLPDRPDGLASEQLAALPKLRERLRETIRRIARFGIPPTLDHGDLHAGNTRLRASGPLIYDWSDGCLTLPLLSLTPIFVWNGCSGSHT